MSLKTVRNHTAISYLKPTSTDNKSISTIISDKTLTLLPTNPLFPSNVSVIKDTLDNTEYTQALSISQEDHEFVLSEFTKKKFNNLANINYDTISTIANKEFNDLNEKLKAFTSQMDKVQTPGLFPMIDDLSKKLHDAELANIWNKAVNAKPTLWAKFLNIFDKKSANISLNSKYEQLTTLVTQRSSGLESKITELEKELVKQENEQRINVKMLEHAYSMYYKTFLELRQQLIFIVFLEEYYKKHLEDLSNVVNEDALVLQNELKDAQTVLEDIQDKRLILHKTVIQLPITAQQNKNLVGVCKNLLKEIQNTRTSSFMSIRTNLVTLGTALKTQQALLTNQSAKDLEHNSSILASEISGNLAVKGVLISSEARLKEVQTVQKLIENLERSSESLMEARQQSQLNIEEATITLLETTNKVKELISS